jgi:4-hydroxybutyryl-CoA dehydratase/vinylacetyl-CoA-Delta-isomerase
MFGKQLDSVVDDPIIRPSMRAVAKTYEMAHRLEHEDIMTATSHISGKKINRFTHIHQSIDDLVKKSKMGRLLGRETGCCFQRCVGMDALNALSIVTHNMDEKYGSGYNQRFLKYLEYVQENDLTCDGAMTDPMHGAGSPQAQRIMISRLVNMAEKQRAAKKLSGVDDGN